MSFGWWCKDKSGGDLFTEFGIHSQAMNLVPSAHDDERFEFNCRPRVEEVWQANAYRDRHEDAARDAMADIQVLVRGNIEALRPCHCDTCTCVLEPKGWDLKMAERFLSIPLERVWRCGGGR